MIVEIGHFLLILSFPVAILLAISPFCAYALNDTRWSNWIPSLVIMKFLLLMASFAALTYAFLHDDFSVTLVAQHSNTALPDYFKFSAVWGNHEGSLLLWTLILSGWTLAVSLFANRLPKEFRHNVLAVLGSISAGFLAFILFTSNPFLRNLISPADEGSDLNPLLQDPGLIFHPPLLYVGYVGFSVAFAFAIAALISGKLDVAWAKWTRPWTNVAWAFLTIGIALGSWWAYYELGWGGWWFWDPVENASIMPWLAGTALIHSLAATEKRGVFKSWTVLLAILAFSLSLLGTFLVRSGILVSVHAFASDPTRGIFILAYLVVVVGGSLTLYALRAGSLKSTSSFKWFSRESSLLVNNILLTATLVVVLCGTLFPLVMNALDLGSYSVGAPYFNAFMLPIGLPMLLLMAFAPFVLWQSNSKTQWKLLNWFFMGFLSIVIAVLLLGYLNDLYSKAFSIGSFTAVFAAIFLMLMTVYNAIVKAARFNTAQNRSRWSGYGFSKLGRSYWGMVLAHTGIAVCAIGIAVTSVYSLQKEVRMTVGDFATLGPYQFKMLSLDNYAASNYVATRATVATYIESEQGRVEYSNIFPEKRRYNASQSIMTEAGIDAALNRDLYVSLGEQIEPEVWAVTVQVKAFVRWIWLGAIFMALGSILAILDARYRKLTAISN